MNRGNGSVRNSNDWRDLKFGDVCDFQGGTQPPKATFQRSAGPGLIRLLQIQDFKTDQYAVYVHDGPRLTKCSERDILIGRYGASVGKIFRGKAGALNVALVKTIPDASVLDQDFLFYWFQHDVFQSAISRISARAAQAGFNKQDLAGLVLSVPPLEEQRRIAARLRKQLSMLAEARAALEAQLEAADALPAANLRNVFESEEAKRWPWRRLGELVTKIGSGLTPLGGHTTYRSSGIPLIRSQNVLMNAFTSKGLAFISEEQDEQMEFSRVELGDVLLNITGASIGRVCVAPKEACPANVNQHVSIIRSNGDVEPRFLSFFLSTPTFQEFIWRTQAGATRQAPTKKIIENFVVPAPPIDLQRSIATKLDAEFSASRALRESIQAKLVEINKLPAALLRAAFNQDGS